MATLPMLAYQGGNVTVSNTVLRGQGKKTHPLRGRKCNGFKHGFEGFRGKHTATHKRSRKCLEIPGLFSPESVTSAPGGGAPVHGFSSAVQKRRSGDSTKPDCFWPGRACRRPGSVSDHRLPGRWLRTAPHPQAGPPP